MDIVCVFILWMLAVVPTVANSCISKSAVCCLVGEIEGKIFFDEIEGPGCSNRGNVQVIFNLIGLGAQAYTNGARAPFYHFRLKTYGEIIPSCSGIGGDYGYNNGYITTLQPYEDGSVYNDTIFLPGASSGYGTDALIGRAVAVYQGRPSRQSNQQPLACCVIGRGQPVSLPLPSPAKPTPLGPNSPIDLSVGQQTKKKPSPFETAPVNPNTGSSNPRYPDVNIGVKKQNGNEFTSNNVPSFNNNQLSGPSKGLIIPGNNVNANNGNTNNNNRKNNNDNNNNAYNGNAKNPKYTFDEDDIDKKFNLIGGYGDGSNFDFNSFSPRSDRINNNLNNVNNNNRINNNLNNVNNNNRINNNQNNINNNANGDYSNVYNQGNKNYNTNTAGVFGNPNTSPNGANSQNLPISSNAGRGGGGFRPNTNNNFNSFNNNGQNRNKGFGNSQFPSVFGSIGSGNFFNLDGKLAGAALINSDPRSSKGFGGGQVGEGVLGSSLTKGFEPPKGPSFQDIYNKPTGESPLSGGGFSDTVSPEEENSISRLFFSNPGIKDTIGLSSDDKFIPRETEDEEESSSYHSLSDSGDDEEKSDSEELPDFNTDVNNLSADDGYTNPDSDDGEGDSSAIRIAPPGDDQIPSSGPNVAGS